MKYSDREDLTQFLDPDSYTESAINMSAEAAADFIHKVTGDQYYRETAVEKTFGGEGKGLLLVKPSLHAVTSVKIYDDYDDTLDDTLELDEYEFGPGWIKRRNLGMRRNYFPVGRGNVRITGDWGWEAVPPLIRLASARLTSAMLMGHAPEDMVSEKLGNYSATYRLSAEAGAAQMSVSGILEMHRLHKIIGGRIRGRRSSLGEEGCPRRWSFIGGE